MSYSRQDEFNPHFRQQEPIQSRIPRRSRSQQHRQQPQPQPPQPPQYQSQPRTPPSPPQYLPGPWTSPPPQFQPQPRTPPSPPYQAWTPPPPPHHPQPNTPPPNHPQPNTPPPKEHPTQPQDSSRQHHQHRHGPHLNQGGLKAPQLRRTEPAAWFVAIFCTIFWVLVILGGLVILIVYLVFRPQSPRFEIQNAALNSAYLDSDILLNADITILANFTNPNKKVGVDFSYIAFEVYYGTTLIATSSVNPFSEARKESKLVNIHLVSSEVRIPVSSIQRMKRQIQGNQVAFEVKGLFRTRSRFGNFLRYTYWLHARCTIVLTNPPSGVLRSRRCRTKR